MKHKLILASLLALTSPNDLFLVLEPEDIPTYANGSHQKIIGYFFSASVQGRNYYPANIPTGKVDVVNYAFANISKEGTVELGDVYVDTLMAYPGDCLQDGCKRGTFH